MTQRGHVTSFTCGPAEFHQFRIFDGFINGNGINYWPFVCLIEHGFWADEERHVWMENTPGGPLVVLEIANRGKLRAHLKKCQIVPNRNAKLDANLLLIR